MYEELRRQMVESQIIARGIRDKNVIDAMLKIPRHEFVPTGYEEEAYGDYPLSIGSGQTISQPYIVALMTQLLELKASDKVLEIGTGSGYQAAILAEIAKKVVTIERVGELSKEAEERLRKYKNVIMVVGDGTQGHPKEAPYDKIIVTAAAKMMPEKLEMQLAENGIMVIPMIEFFYQKLMRYKKKSGKLEGEHITDVVFVPLLGDY